MFPLNRKPEGSEFSASLELMVVSQASRQVFGSCGGNAGDVAEVRDLTNVGPRGVRLGTHDWRHW